MGNAASGNAGLTRGAIVVVEGHSVTLDRKLGAGGFAEVWAARCSPALQRTGGCVLKRARVDSSNAEGLSLARRELAVLRALPAGCPFLVGALAVEEARERTEGGEFFRFDILMERLGVNCHEEATRHAARGEPLLERTLLCRFRDIAGALAVLHAQSPPIVHFDVKLENVLLRMQRGAGGAQKGGGLSAQGDGGDVGDECAALCDFGSARPGGLDCAGRGAFAQRASSARKIAGPHASHTPAPCTPSSAVRSGGLCGARHHARVPVPRAVRPARAGGRPRGAARGRVGRGRGALQARLFPAAL